MTSTATHQPNLQGLAVLPADRTLPTATAPISRPRHQVQEYFPERTQEDQEARSLLVHTFFFMSTNERISLPYSQILNATKRPKNLRTDYPLAFGIKGPQDTQIV